MEGYENREQLTSISVSTKGKKQVGTIQLSKYAVYIQDVPNPNMLYICKVCPKSAQTVSKCWDNDKDQMSEIANLPKTINNLGRHSCLPKFHLTRCDLDSLYIEICCSRQVHEK